MLREFFRRLFRRNAPQPTERRATFSAPRLVDSTSVDRQIGGAPPPRRLVPPPPPPPRLDVVPPSAPVTVEPARPQTPDADADAVRAVATVPLRHEGLEAVEASVVLPAERDESTPLVSDEVPSAVEGAPTTSERPRVRLIMKDGSVAEPDDPELESRMSYLARNLLSREFSED